MMFFCKHKKTNNPGARCQLVVDLTADIDRHQAQFNDLTAELEDARKVLRAVRRMAIEHNHAWLYNITSEYREKHPKALEEAGEWKLEGGQG
jgi:stress response protein YsnF